MGDQKTRELRSPPADKAHSYERDCRDAYAENNKSKRKAIPLFKAASNRQGRHLAKVVVARTAGDDGAGEDRRLAAADRKALRPVKRKTPDRPLGAVLARRKRDG